jgi:HD-GYP domain-containing protein (c-di-GMP phosphodiesterase class II)
LCQGRFDDERAHILARVAGSGGAPAVRSAELWAALSLATDLGIGQPLEHGLRTSVLAVRLAELAGADEGTATVAHSLALLHSLGSTADAHEAATFYGDDIAARADFARVDVSRSREIVGFFLRQVGTGTGPPVRIARFIEAVAAGRGRAGEGLAAQCEVADRLAARLGVGDGVRGALGFAFERWDGNGFPAGAEGEAIPRAARLLHVARDADAFFALGGVEAARKVLGDRSGTAYEPDLAARFVAGAAELFAELDSGSAWEAALAAEPADRRALDAAGLDEACRVGGDLADLKSPYTLGHARAVAGLAEAAAARLDLGDREVARVRRAALLADLGRVGVSTAIWNKRAALNRAEWERVRLHPYFTERALRPAAGLAAIERAAAAHQERLDGSGYHRGLPASAQPMPVRLLAAADAFRAMVERRPHRPALAAEEAARELGAEVRDGRIDGDAARAVLAAAGERAPAADDPPPGLSAGEVEVLRLVARGLTNRAIAAALDLSPTAVEVEVERAKAAVGASSRAGAALAAVEHGLLPE